MSICDNPIPRPTTGPLRGIELLLFASEESRRLGVPYREMLAKLKEQAQ